MVKSGQRALIESGSFLFNEEIFDFFVPGHAERLKSVAAAKIAHRQRPSQARSVKCRLHEASFGSWTCGVAVNSL